MGAKVWFKRISAALVVALLAGALLSPGADAHRRGRKAKNKTVSVSDVTIDFTDSEPTLGLTPLLTDADDYFSGTISRVKNCDGQQVVEVMRSSGGKIGETMAASNGDWKVVIEDPGSDSYFAKVTGTNKRNNKVCARGTSAVIEVTDGNSNLLGIPTV
jgi:hypothetical protein